MSDEVLIAIIGAVGVIGAPTLAAIIQARKSRRAGVKDEHIQEAGITGDLRALVEVLSGEIDRLREDQTEDREQIRQTRQELRETRDEIASERRLRNSAIEYIRLLHSWIGHWLPGVDPPAVPKDIAPHIIITPKENP